MLLVMNKGASVYDAIEKIAATSSKLQKEDLIKQAGSSPLFMKVCRAAYDPFVNYGMRALPDRDPNLAPGQNSLEEPWVWETIEKLAKRELSGSAAWAAVEKALNFLEPKSGELLRRIIRKDLRASFSEDTINRVFQGTFQDFPYQRCSLPDKSNMEKWDWSVGVISQEKADGMFSNVNRDQETVWVTTRQGSPFPLDKLGNFESALWHFAPIDTQSHGEFTVYKDGQLLAREVGNGILNSIIQGGDLPDGHFIKFEVWDQIPLAAVQPKGKYNVPYKERLRQLIGNVHQMRTNHPDLKHMVDLIPTRVVKSKSEAYGHYRELLGVGKEGTVCKHPEATWKDGTSKDQVKLKLEVDVDLRIRRVVPGTPGTKNEGRPGSLECESECGALVTNVTVKNEKMRAAIESNEEAFIGGIMVVRSNSIMPPSESNGLHSLFLPRFVEDTVRLDKAVADDLAQVQDIFRNAVEAA